MSSEFWNLFFSWEGRLNRKPFFVVLLITEAFVFFPGALMGALFFKSLDQQILIWHILDLIILIITGCPTIKRLHDCGYSGAWYALFILLFLLSLLSTHMVLTLVGLLILCSLLILPGTKGPNAYGVDPRGVIK
jgi:uncharacterized membrane protein YhaH (DUF805 family)